MKNRYKVDCPKDIKYLIDRLEFVKRFNHPLYPQGVFNDDTKKHTLRLVSFALSLNLVHDHESKLLRMLFIHDLPEIRYGDVSVIEKLSSKKNLQKVLEDEETVSRQILCDSDFRLFQEFQRSYKYLSSLTKVLDKHPEVSILANLIDRMDGNMYYHKKLTHWIKSPKYKKKLLPPVHSLINSFTNDMLYLERINKIKNEINSDYYNLFLMLLGKKRESLISFWSTVPKRRIPEELIIYLKNEKFKKN